MNFFQDNNTFSFVAAPLNSEQLGSGLWLTLVGVHEIPPHIALINEAKYYSISARKVDCGSPLERFMNTLDRKRVPALFVRIENKQSQTPGALNSATIQVSPFKESPFSGLGKNAEDKNVLLQSIYKNLQPLGNSAKTCLSPIKEFFSYYYSPEFANASYVFELLAIAEKKKLIKECLSVFCEKTNSNIVTLPKYTMIQIKNKITALSSQTASVNNPHHAPI